MLQNEPAHNFHCKRTSWTEYSILLSFWQSLEFLHQRPFLIKWFLDVWGQRITPSHNMYPVHGQRLIWCFHRSLLWQVRSLSWSARWSESEGKMFLWFRGDTETKTNIDYIWHHRTFQKSELLDGTSCTSLRGARGIISDAGLREVVTVARFSILTP